MPQDRLSVATKIAAMSASTLGRFKAAVDERRFSAAWLLVGQRQASPRSRQRSCKLMIDDTSTGASDLPLCVRRSEEE